MINHPTSNDVILMAQCHQNIVYLIPMANTREQKSNEQLHRTTIQITVGQYEALKSRSKPGTSISSIVREAITMYFSKEEDPVSLDKK